ncbi:FecCD family ABC transporter permease [Microbacterium nymphoidis]|uniref:FecCD family ABC transporter permease n=1 Tax=Microbacterium nymphoidis TaxID=2898586 RepID=UPI001E5F38E1|nr:iron chelate uptake ABC transporter family permease subunit [Microbacterium nymphoidis]MCD2498487.1 iron chelate uptake ABC transporter family permease subunit [Microbacterium nymphoidis]
MTPARISVHSAVAVIGLVTLLLGALLGSYAVSLEHIWGVLTGQIQGFERTVVLEWRIPRAAAALLVGACLGLSGAILQTVTRNALASPDLIGISGGAYTAVLILVVLVSADWAYVAPAALIGALLAAAALFAVSGSRSQQRGSRFLLAGVALAALLGGINSWIVVSASLESAMAAATWGAGSLAASTWSTVWLSGTTLALGAALCALTVRRLRVHALGDDLAASLGAAPRSLRIQLIAIAVALAAIATAICGPIGLLPLVAPPIARALSRTSETPLALSAMLAAVLLAIADLIAQHILPGGPPAGLVTTVLGGVYLMLMLLRR